MLRIPSLLLGVCLTASVLAAQAPIVTPGGDPSVDSDSRYALAVDPADYPDQPFVFLLDDGILRLEEDGRGTRTYRQVIQILTKEAVDAWSEQTFAYVNERERFTLNWIRVVRPDGTVISDGPAQRQESSDMPDTEYPIYTDARTIRVTLGGVAVGTIVDFSATTETINPVLSGDFTAGWRVNPGYPVRRSRYIVDVPDGLDVHLEERNVGFMRQEQRANGRHVYLWATEDVAPYEVEPFAGFPNEVVVSINLAGAIGWDSVASWYNGLSRDRYEIDDAIRAAAAAQLLAARTLDDTLRQLHRWAAQDFRYVSLSLGIGGYQPRTPAQVFESRFGDCKDKATLFVSVARALGIPAHPVIVALNGAPDSTTPSISQFDHMIAAVERGRGFVFLDLTADLIPFGEVPEYLQGEMGLLVRPDGRSQLVRFPENPPEDNRIEVTITGELTADGTFNGWYVRKATGTRQTSLRSAMLRPSTMTVQDSTRWLLGIAGSVFRGATADSADLFDGRDLEAEARMALKLRAPSAATRAGRSYVFTLPMPSFASPGLVANLETMDERRFPIDVTDVVGPITSTWVMEVRLPDKWKAELPKGISARGPFGTYRSSYAQRGRTLTVTRQLIGRSGLEPKEKFPELIEWFRAVAEDDFTLIAITPGR